MLKSLKFALAPATAFLAVIRYWKGRDLAALRLFERAEKWMPGCVLGEPLHRAHLGLCLHHLGRKAEAIAHLETVVPLLSEYRGTSKQVDLAKSLLEEVNKALSEVGT